MKSKLRINNEVKFIVDIFLVDLLLGYEVNVVCF